MLVPAFRIARWRPTQLFIRWGILLAAAAAFQAPAILFNVGIPTHDFLIHYHWAVEFSDAFAAGDPYPRWMGRAFYGLGEPALLYYSPLFYVWTALLRPITGNTWDAMRLVFLFSTFLTGIFGHRMLRTYASESFSLLGGMCLQAAPMIIMLYHFAAELPWAVSFPILVATLHYATRPGAFGKLIEIPISVCVCLLVMTHVLSAFMLILCLSCCFLVHLKIGKGVLRIGKPAWSWAISVAIGLLLSSVYLLPALTSLKYISPGFYVGAIDMWTGFSFPLVTALLSHMRWFAFQWIVSGAILVCVAVATWLAMERPDHRDPLGRTMTFLLIAAWVSLFLASELSAPFWLLVPQLQMLQFPYRFIYIASAAGVLANLLMLWETRQVQGGGAVARALAAAPLALSILLAGALDAKMIARDGQKLDLRSDDRSLYPGAREYLLRTAANEWHSHGEANFQEHCKRNGLVCAPPGRTGDRIAFHIDTNRTQAILLPVFAFPAWRAGINGAPVDIHVDRGLVSVRLPKGSDDIVLTWRRLPQERAGMWLTALAFVFCLFLSAWRLRRA